jgi:hypothetical protein
MKPVRVAVPVLTCYKKSQLAIEHCYRLREQSPETWVMWIHASSATRFNSSIRDAADQLGIAGWDVYGPGLAQKPKKWEVTTHPGQRR